LGRFVNGGGRLFDLEYLTYENGQRVAAFGKAAGTAGMALGLKTWSLQKLNPKSKKPLPPITKTYESLSVLQQEVKQALEQYTSTGGKLPRVAVLGALGRSGSAAVNFIRQSQLRLETLQWDLKETKGGGPFPELLNWDILVNCVFVNQPINPFLTKDLLNQHPERKLTVICDVSCDVGNAKNPLPIVDDITSFVDPSIRIIDDPPVDVIAIDHLPSLIPRVSSKEFVDDLIKHLVDFPKTPVWQRALNLFFQYTQSLR